MFVCTMGILFQLDGIHTPVVPSVMTTEALVCKETEVQVAGSCAAQYFSGPEHQEMSLPLESWDAPRFGRLLFIHVQEQER